MEAVRIFITVFLAVAIRTLVAVQLRSVPAGTQGKTLGGENDRYFHAK